MNMLSRSLFQRGSRVAFFKRSRASSSVAYERDQAVLKAFEPLAKPWGLEVKYINDTMGKGLFTNRAIGKGNIIFVERPMFSTCLSAGSELENPGYRRVDVVNVHETVPNWMCGWCFKALGEELTAPNVLKAVVENPSEILSPDLLEESSEAQVECREHCHQRYCSPDCESMAWDHHHALLCAGPRPKKDHPMVQFDELAKRTGWWSIKLALQIVAAVHMEAKRSDWQTAASPLLAFAAVPWTELNRGMPLYSQPPAALLDQFQQIVDKWLAHHNLPPLTPEKLDLDLVLGICALSSQVYNGIFPLDEYSIRVKALLESYEQNYRKKHAYGDIPNWKLYLSYLPLFQRKLRPPVFTALTPLHSTMNHSCDATFERNAIVNASYSTVVEPYVKMLDPLPDLPKSEEHLKLEGYELVNFDGTTSSRDMFVVASRDISPGEQIYIGYLDSAKHPNVEARREILRNKYLIECQCRLCTTQLKTLQA